MNNLLNKAFSGYISIDSVPANKVCEGCGEAAIHRCLVTGGISHNQTGLYCGLCSEAFAFRVEHAIKNGKAKTQLASTDVRERVSRCLHVGDPSEQCILRAQLLQEEDGDEIVTLDDYMRWVSPTFAQG